MSFLKKLFGAGGAPSAKVEGPAAPVAQEKYRDFTIEATPIAEGGQFRLSGTVCKGTGEARREHRFVRADLFQSVDEAAHTALRKGRQLIDEQGDALFKS